MAEKLYYSMGEVAEMFDVNQSLIRHWESQFSVLRPKRNKKGNRLFTPQDVENLKRIYHLVKERGMTLEGAKRAMRRQPAGDAADRSGELLERLQRIRALLVEVREDLKAADGEIVAVGKNVTERKVGDRVSCESHIPCGECYFCKNGMPHICKNVKLFGCTQNGAFAEYAKIRWDCTFLLEDDVTDEAACMFEPMGAGIHGVEAAEVNGKTVLVSGCGPIGLTAISASKTFGAVKVIACDLIDEKLEVAKKMGADAVLNSAKCDLPAEVRTLTGGVGVDAAIDITGAEPALNSALKCLRAAGRLVCVGLPTKPITFHDMTDDLVYREVQLTGVSGRKIWETWEDFAKVMKGPYFKLDQVIGGRFPMKDFEAALAQIHSGVPGKMILYP